MIEALKKARDLISPCEPPLWALSGHLQTILGHFLPSPAVTEVGQVCRVPLGKDSEQIHTTYYRGQKSVVVYLFHGLGGSAEATYMQRTAILAREIGCHVFI